MKIESGAIWSEASAMVSANKEVLAALAGVFFMLPAFAFAVLIPQPQPQPGMEPEAMLNLMLEFYRNAAPWFVLTTIIQALGQLAAFVLLTRPGKVTVGEALKESLSALLPYLGAQLLVTFGMGLVVAVIFGLASATGSAGLMVAAGLLGAGLAVYLSIRLIMILPAIAIDGLRNPIAAIKRSASLTQGQVGPILLFFFLMALAFVVTVIVAGIVVGSLFGLLGGARAAEIAGAGVSGLLGAGFSLYVVASLAAMHRRLSSGSAREHGDTFS
jgi:Membrane domain of glycerophosphoryl diester phosphodiesterase